MSGDPYPKEAQLGRRTGEMRNCAADGCSREFYAAARHIKRGQARFCSRACAYRSRPAVPAERRERMRQSMRALDRSGKRNPNFRHGLKAGSQIRGWTVAAKGETCCRACGRSDARLHLHHAVPRSICPPEARRDLRNGITLCTHCHISLHRGGLTLPRSIFRPEEWAYVSGLKLTGRKTKAWLDKHYPAGIRYGR